MIGLRRQIPDNAATAVVMVVRGSLGGARGW